MALYTVSLLEKKKKETNIEAIDTTTTTKDHLEKEGHMTREGLGSRWKKEIKKGLWKGNIVFGVYITFGSKGGFQLFELLELSIVMFHLLLFVILSRNV